MRPALLLADEPTGNLDSEAGRGVLALLGELHRDGQTILLVTHDPKIASRADRILFMRDGQLVNETRPRDFGTDSLERIVDPEGD